MFGPYPLTSPPIRKHVLTKPGAYVLFTDKNEPVYSGRSDTDLNTEIQRHLPTNETSECIRAKNANKFSYQNTVGPKEAHDLECTNYHKYNPPCNEKHPEKSNAEWNCPICKS
ncbi:MAG: hypothetical protein L0Y68_09305 [Candidatus Dadabacteria bacterium]|nr:hypothetical protein [Candidatus Dadabacteria bacterium]